MYPLASKDSSFEAFGPQAPIIQGFLGYFDAKGIRFYTANQRRATIVSDRAIWGGGLHSLSAWEHGGWLQCKGLGFRVLGLGFRGLGV